MGDIPGRDSQGNRVKRGGRELSGLRNLENTGDK